MSHLNIVFKLVKAQELPAKAAETALVGSADKQNQSLRAKAQSMMLRHIMHRVESSFMAREPLDTRSLKQLFFLWHEMADRLTKYNPDEANELRTEFKSILKKHKWNTQDLSSKPLLGEVMDHSQPSLRRHQRGGGSRGR